MLSFSVIAIALAAATSTMAHPAAKLSARTTPGPWCDGLGAGAFDTASGFTIAALNTTGANSNSTGAPIVVNSAGSFSDITVWQLGTWAQYQYPLEYTSIALENGTLVISGDGAPPAQADPVDAGNSLEWASRPGADPKNGAQVYCAVPDATGSGYPVLAVNGDADSFSLCQLTFENVVWYKAAPNRGYHFDTCYPVKLQLIF
ncbi:hypothetical protein BN946_scf184873.g18 [Trametes cinnabarina]|uniref:Uncharacterized protein n=1 Tax=Pycnoporus cinnabarinus TaxID=5643 RepID=A0A060SUN3_PYCCI|nr:hypothetical protein BN946_scf184873.g18 [Trametes cinnabarina]